MLGAWIVDSGHFERLKTAEVYDNPNQTKATNFIAAVYDWND